MKINGKDTRSANYLFGLDCIRFVNASEIDPSEYSFKVEGEDLEVVSFNDTNGRSHWVQPIMDGVFSSNHQLIWFGPFSVGETLTLKFNSVNSFSGNLKSCLCKAVDMGIYQIYIDGKAYGEPIDCYNPQVVWSGPVNLGHIDLSAGEHQVQIKIVGKNDKAIGYTLGFDALFL